MGEVSSLAKSSLSQKSKTKGLVERLSLDLRLRSTKTIG